MMEEFDFEAEEILVIHPDEDIRKIETDTNSNFEQASDSDIRKTEVMETDTNSNLEQASDSDISKIEAIETDTNSNLEQASDSESRKIEAFETDTNSNLEQTLDSDSGEIDDDEEANDLEEGEINDSSPVSMKKSDIACRFFKRGSCAYGSQCQYLHVSDTVYKMFDTNPQKRNDMPLVEHHSFPKPIIFPPIVLPPRPFIEPPIPVALKTDFHRQCDTFEDTWEKGLEQARILIRNANLKKKIEESEQKKLNSNNNKDEKIKGHSFTKADLGSELDFNNKKYCEKNSANSSLRKENSYDEKKSNYRSQPKSSDKWVDPWRRSKSPLIRKRLRSVSGSPPSRSRKHSSTSSTSSASSSSSEIGDIYRRPYEKKSPRGQQRFKSRSRSVSQSRRPKKRRISPKHSFNGRRNPRSDSRSLSISSFRKRTFSSRGQPRSSSSSSSCSDCQISPTAEDKKMKKISAKLSEQISQKSPKRASESFNSDCETSEMTVSSASCTSPSSDSEAEILHHNSLKSKKSPNRNNASFYSNKTTSLSNPKVFNRNQSNLLKNRDLVQRKNDIVPAYRRKMQQPSDNSKNLSNWGFKTEPIDYKLKNTSSYFSSVKKPTSASKFSENKISGDRDLLSAYQRKMQPSDNSKNLNNWDFETEPTDFKPKNTTSYFSSVRKPTSAPKVSENKMSGDFELLSAYQRKMQPSDNRKNLNNCNFKTDPTDSNPKNTASYFSSVKKPASAPKASEGKLSGDMELLFMYQGLGSSNKNSSNVQKEKSTNPISKPNRTKDAVNETNKANGNSQSCDNASKVGNTPKKNIVLNLQPKCKDYFKTELFNKPQDLDEMVTIKKETASKRDQLLNKLKLIDDAIARKKGK